MNLGNTGIGIVNTSSQVDGKKHGFRKVANAPARAAFIALMRINIFGLASVLKKTAFEVDSATTAKQSAPNFWWDVQARWRNAWYNLGGDWWKLVAAINKGSSRRPLGKDIAPKKIKNKLNELGIGSIGIGAIDPVTLTAAATIIAALTPLVMQTLSLVSAKKTNNTQNESVEFINVDGSGDTGGSGSKDEDGFFTDADGNLTTAGYGTIGAVLMLGLILATKPIKKKRKKK